MSQDDTRRTRASPTVFRSVLGTALVGFAVLLAMFLRDLVLSGQTCPMDTRDWPPGITLWQFCVSRTQAAVRRLWWEAASLVLAGGLIYGKLGTLPTTTSCSGLALDPSRP